MGMDSDWAVQISVKDWPVPGAMVNARGMTAAAAVAHFAETAEFTNEVRAATVKMQALNTVGQQFPTMQRVDTSPVSSQGGSGEACLHGPREYRQGFKNGKKWEGLFCTAPKGSGECAVKWIDR